MNISCTTIRASQLAVALVFLAAWGQHLGGQALAPAQPVATAIQPGEDTIPRHAGALQVLPMSFQEQTGYYVRHSLDAGSLLSPALPAAILMASPPRRYPRDWKDGGPALARNFGDALATEEAAKTAKYLSGALLGEDPRYFPSTAANPFHRVFHALAFTVVDTSTHGKRRLAVSNFAGSAAAGFVGMAYLPQGYSDLIHAGQRAGGTYVGYVPTLLVGYATQNLVDEFKPELKSLGRKLHLPVGR